jgi:hypothetical protein
MAAPFRAPLDKRQSCVTCPANPPACPACPAGQECQITSQSCQQCAQSQCISSSTLTTLVSTTASPPPGSNTGAIAGGIVGALVLAGIAAGVLFWYIRKKKQATEEMDMWLSSAHADGSVEKDPSLSAGRKSVLLWLYFLTAAWSIFLARFNRHHNDTCFQCHPHRLHTLSFTRYNDVW